MFYFILFSNTGHVSNSKSIDYIHTLLHQTVKLAEIITNKESIQV